MSIKKLKLLPLMSEIKVNYMNDNTLKGCL